MFYTSKITLEVTINHRDDPVSIAHFLKAKLSVPAVDSLKILDIETNFRVHQDPDSKMVQVPIPENL